MALGPQVIDCRTWADLDNAIEVLVGDQPYQWLFRGQRVSRWPLQPTIERILGSRSQLDIEQRLLNEFRSKAHLYTPHLPPMDDVLGWFSVMQHHGIATRLLDWTYSAYVGLFFAIGSQSSDEEGALWAVHADTLTTAFRREAKTVLRSTYGRVSGRDPEDFKNIALPPAFSRGPSPGLVATMLPSFHVSRLSSQQGCFLVNCNYRMAFEESLAGMMSEATGAWLFKIVFPQTLRAVILRRLMHFNIHPATLFPDLEGLAAFINLKDELFPTPLDRTELPTVPGAVA